MGPERGSDWPKVTQPMCGCRRGKLGNQVLSLELCPELGPGSVQLSGSVRQFAGRVLPSSAEAGPPGPSTTPGKNPEPSAQLPRRDQSPSCLVERGAEGCCPGLGQASASQSWSALLSLFRDPGALQCRRDLTDAGFLSRQGDRPGGGPAAAGRRRGPGARGQRGWAGALGGR